MKTAWHLCSISFFLSVLWVAPLSNGRNAHTRVYQVFDRKECCALSLSISLLSQRYCAIGTTGFVTGCACTRCERSLLSHLMHTYILVVVVVLFLFFFFCQHRRDYSNNMEFIYGGCDGLLLANVRLRLLRSSIYSGLCMARNTTYDILQLVCCCIMLLCSLLVVFHLI